MHAFRKTSLCLVLAIAAPGAYAASAVPPCPDVSATVAHAGAHDFDFLMGAWSVHNRRLKQRLANSHEWTEFDAKDSFAQLAGGLGTEEHYATDFWKGYAALGLHLYDPQHRLWTLYWADNRNASGTMQTLAKGAFVGGAGVFAPPTPSMASRSRCASCGSASIAITSAGNRRFRSIMVPVGKPTGSWISPAGELH